MNRSAFPALGLLISIAVASAQLALIRQGRESAGSAEANDYFGGAVACGDFNGDGYDDVAIGAPFDNFGLATTAAGAVTVNYGSEYGVTWLGARYLLPSDGGYDNTQHAQMGSALAVGDFNDDGFEDLAVGLPAEAVNGQVSAGAVLVYFGGASGLSLNAFRLTQAAFGAVPEAGDRFGASLATGRLGTDSFADLAIGSPNENSAAGAVFVIFGNAGGLNVGETLVLDSAAIGLVPEPGSFMGTSVAIGNVRSGAAAELIIGAPLSDVGATPNAGRVHIIRGTAAGLGPLDRLSIDMTVTGAPVEANAYFGRSFAVGNFDGGLDGMQDVAIGIPGMLGGAGRVVIARGIATGNPSYQVLLLQTNMDTQGASEAGDAFGEALAAGDFTGDGIDDLAVGSPGEDVVNSDGVPTGDSGWVHIHAGSAGGGAQPSGIQLISVESHGEAYLSVAPNGHAGLGVALAFGKTSANVRASLLAAAPVRDGNTGQVYDYAPWRQVPALECRTALAADCEGNIIYALKPFERVKIASTTKIMTVLLGCEATARPLIDPFHVALDEEYTIEDWLANTFPPSSGCSIFGYAPLGIDVQSFENLLRQCIMVSGNDSAHAIADAMTGEANAWFEHTGTVPIFVNLMNTRAAELDMDDTFFTNPPGVDDGEPYSTAYDMWLLAKTAMQNELFRNIVGHTGVAMKHFVSPETGIFQESHSKIAYGWLVDLKSRDKRIVGLKPGGTPGAGTTGVVALQPGDSPTELAYADGFGWADGGTSKDQLIALAQLAARYCGDPLDYDPPPGGLTGPIVEATWRAGDTVREGVQAVDFPSGAQDPAMTLPGETITLLMYPLAAVPAGASPTVPVRWSYRALWTLPAGKTTGVKLDPASGFSGVLRNLGGTAAGLTIQLQPAGTTVNIGLAPNQTYSLPEWAAAAGLSAEVHLTITATNFAILSSELRFDLAPNLGAVPASAFRARLTPDTAPGRAGWYIGESTIGSGTNPLSFPVLVAVEDPARELRYAPTIGIESFAITREPAKDGVSLRFSTPIGGSAFYQNYTIEMATSLSAPNWARTATLPAQPAGTHVLYQDIFIPADSRYFRVRGNLLAP
jgi:D-alanyl-D-alanine carboxypeptidase